IYKMADEALPQFNDWLEGISDALGFSAEHDLDKIDYSAPGSIVVIVDKLKGRERARQKTYGENHGNWNELLDVVRGTIAVDSFGDLYRTVDELKKRGIKLARLPKNRFDDPTPQGYRDLMMNV